MAAMQDITPLNGEIVDSMVAASKMEWQETEKDKAWIKILWTGSETGTWAVLFKWAKGYVAVPHKHLSASHTFVIKGKLQVRDGTLDAGDYVYEPNGVLHMETKALEDTEYLFICHGPLLFFNDDGITSYMGWEEVERMKSSDR